MLSENNQILKSIWFWCGLTTAIYFTFNLFGYPNERTLSKEYNQYVNEYIVTHQIKEVNRYEKPSIISYIAGFVGLFVPYGQRSFIFFLISPLPWASVIFFFFSTYFIESKLNKPNTNLLLVIILNLLLLILLTIVVDFIRFTPFESWKIFLNGSFD